MPLVVQQDQDHAAGVARLLLADRKGIDPATVEIRITTQAGGSDRHLDPSQTGEAAWAPSDRWFLGGSAAAQGAGLSIELGPAATWHLKPFQPYSAAFRDASGLVVQDRLIWIDMRLPSNPPPPVAPVSAANAGVSGDPETDMQKEPEVGDPLAAFAELADTQEPEAIVRSEEPVLKPDPERKGKGLWVGLSAVLLLIAASVGGWLYLQDTNPDTDAPVTAVTEAVTPADKSDATPAPPIPLTIEGARAYINDRKPAAPDALAEAERFAEGGQHQAAFLLTKYAAQKGLGQAQFRMGRYYDPESHDAALGVIPQPDPTIAADWYQQAAESGEASAMLRLGELLKQGDVAWPDAPERAVFWLRKAAEAGSDKARELLQ